jgi:hypothetical protein
MKEGMTVRTTTADSPEPLGALGIALMDAVNSAQVGFHFEEGGCGEWQQRSLLTSARSKNQFLSDISRNLSFTPGLWSLAEALMAAARCFRHPPYSQMRPMHLPRSLLSWLPLSDAAATTSRRTRNSRENL